LVWQYSSLANLTHDLGATGMQPGSWTKSISVSCALRLRARGSRLPCDALTWDVQRQLLSSVDVTPAFDSSFSSTSRLLHVRDSRTSLIGRLSQSRVMMMPFPVHIAHSPHDARKKEEARWVCSHAPSSVRATGVTAKRGIQRTWSIHRVYDCRRGSPSHSTSKAAD